MYGGRYGKSGTTISALGRRIPGAENVSEESILPVHDLDSEVSEAKPGGIVRTVQVQVQSTSVEEVGGAVERPRSVEDRV